MMLCIASAGAVAALAASSFTLSWTHSVEHTQWRESWVVQGDRLQVVEASVEGSGAGIAVPPDAVWADGRWSYKPVLGPLPSLNLAASGMTPSPWTLCTPDGQCLALGEKAGEVARLWAGPSCDRP
ncbi:hypothetical protein ASD80_12620 [Devosia sp. Root635]|nr:hypothetical protein ASD80_12620 [Devosia sp. Root635]